MNDVRDQLTAFWATLQVQWETTRSAWRDAVALSFERDYWSELESEMPRLLAVLEDLEDSLASARDVEY